MQRRVLVRSLVAVVGLALVLTGCGEDDGARVTTIGGSGSASASGASGSASGSVVGDQACSPVGEDREADADTTVDVTLTDYAIDPSSIEVDAGVVTFATTNEGGEAHELAVLPGGGDVPLDEDGHPDEAALAEAGAFELEAYGPGRDCSATWELEPGEYTLFCIVEAADGETHAEKGMVGSLTVD